MIAGLFGILSIICNIWAAVYHDDGLFAAGAVYLVGSFIMYELKNR